MDQALLQQFGSELRAAREASGRSVDEIAKQTRIHRRYIDAIEAGDLASLPPGPYVPAFLREFARAVGLKVPQELAITSSINHGLTTTTLQSAPIVRNQPNNSISNSVTKTAVGTAKLAGNVAKSAVKTTGSVIKAVEGGVNDAVGVFTSRSLREEADLVRRERLGLAKFPEEARDAIGTEQETDHDLEAITDPPALDASYEAITDQPEVQPVIEEPVAPQPVTKKTAAKAVKAPMIPLEITSDDPISGDATLKLGKTSRKFPVTNLVIFALLIAFGFVAYYAIRDVKEKTRPDNAQNELLHEEELPTATTTPENTAETPATQPAPAPDITGATQPTDDSLRFQLKANDVVWVSIGSDANTPFRGELKAGDVKTFTASERFVVNLGNQKALDMMFNGTRLSNLPTIKNSGMVVRNLVLTRDRVSLNGAEVNTSSSALATASTTTPSTTVKKPAPSTSTPKSTASKTTTVSKTASSSKTATTVKKTTTATKTPVKKPAAKKPTLIPTVDPRPATAN